MFDCCRFDLLVHFDEDIGQRGKVLKGATAHAEGNPTVLVLDLAVIIIYGGGR